MERKDLKIYEFRLAHQAMPQTIEAFNLDEAVTEINRMYPYAQFGQVTFKGYASRQ